MNRYNINIDKKGGRFSTKNLLTFLLCLVSATVVWYGHALNSVRNATISLPITYAGIPENVGLSEPLPTSLEVVLRDAGKRLGYYMQMEASIELDLSGQFNAEHGHVQLTADQIRPKLSDFVQGTTALQTFTPDAIHADYSKQHEKTVPVIYQGQIEPAAQYHLVGETQLDYERIKIYGSRAALDSTQYILTERMAIKNAKDSVIQQVRLVAPDGIRLSRDQITVRAFYERYTEKTIQVPLHAVSNVHGQQLKLFDNMVSVVVQVGIDQYTEISENSVHAYVEYTPTEGQLLPVQIEIRDPHIFSARVTPSRVEYIMESL